jgi:hypothetical protein
MHHLARLSRPPIVFFPIPYRNMKAKKERENREFVGSRCRGIKRHLVADGTNSAEFAKNQLKTATNVGIR